MPVMNRKHGKERRIFEDIMGTPPNQHRAMKRDPYISRADIEKTVLSLGLSGGAQQLLLTNNKNANTMMPESGGIL